MAKPVPPSSTRSENTTAVCVVCGKLVRLGGAMTTNDGQIYHQDCPEPRRKETK